MKEEQRELKSCTVRAKRTPEVHPQDGQGWSWLGRGRELLLHYLSNGQPPENPVSTPWGRPAAWHW